MKNIPAFPNNFLAEDRRGMTLRDYFAAKAMSYWLCIPIDKEQLNKVATESYKVADAMMEARK
jgi:hypothetical protein